MIFEAYTKQTSILLQKKMKATTSCNSNWVKSHSLKFQLEKEIHFRVYDLAAERHDGRIFQLIYGAQ